MNTNFKKPELLSPAGSFEALKSAVSAGCDACYVGGASFGARAYADNFDNDTMLRAIEYMHNRGKALHLTVNTLLKEEEIKLKLYDYLLPFYVRGIDAVIVQDLGVMRFILDNFPGLDVHISTQMGIMSVDGARLMKSEGAKRVVLARELTFAEINDIKGIEDLEVEVFVHGALCYGYSGQCLFSSSIGERSGNRGRCAQSCRLEYTCDNGDKAYIFSPKDMCGLDALYQLKNVDSLKIEGRMKNPDYVGVVTSVYRQYVDMACSVDSEADYKVALRDVEALKQVFNRGGFNKGYLISNYDADMMSMKRPNHEGVLLGKIDAIGKGNITFETEYDIYKGDVIDLRDGDKDLDITLTSPDDYKAHDNVTLNSPRVKELNKGISLYRMKSQGLVDNYTESDGNAIPLKMDVRFVTGDEFSVKIRNLSNDIETVVTGDVVDEAKKAPVTEDSLKKALLKFGGTDYYVADIDVEISDNAFLPVGAIKALRREAVERLEEAVCARYERDVRNTHSIKWPDNYTDSANGPEAFRYVYVSQKEQYERLRLYDGEMRVIIPYELIDSIDIEEYSDVYIAFPNMFRANAVDMIEAKKEVFSGVRGVLCLSVDSLAFALTRDYIPKEIIIGDSLYAFNSVAYDYVCGIVAAKGSKAIGVVAPLEVTFKEIASVDRPFIITIYGKQRLMTTALCVKKNTNRCNKTSDYVTIIDRKGRKLKVYSACKYCSDDIGRRNVIYNDEPIYYSVDDINQDVLLSGTLTAFVDENADDIISVLEGNAGCDRNYGHRYNGVD